MAKGILVDKNFVIKGRAASAHEIKELFNRSVVPSWFYNSLEAEGQRLTVKPLSEKQRHDLGQLGERSTLWYKLWESLKLSSDRDEWVLVSAASYSAKVEAGASAVLHPDSPIRRIAADGKPQQNDNISGTLTDPESPLIHGWTGESVTRHQKRRAKHPELERVEPGDQQVDGKRGVIVIRTREVVLTDFKVDEWKLSVKIALTDFIARIRGTERFKSSDLLEPTDDLFILTTLLQEVAAHAAPISKNSLHAGHTVDAEELDQLEDAIADLLAGKTGSLQQPATADDARKTWFTAVSGAESDDSTPQSEDSNRTSRLLSETYKRKSFLVLEHSPSYKERLEDASKMKLVELMHHSKGRLHVLLKEGEQRIHDAQKQVHAKSQKQHTANMELDATRLHNAVVKNQSPLMRGAGSNADILAHSTDRTGRVPEIDGKHGSDRASGGGRIMGGAAAGTGFDGAAPPYVPKSGDGTPMSARKDFLSAIEDSRPQETTSSGYPRIHPLPQNSSGPIIELIELDDRHSAQGGFRHRSK